MNSIFKKLLQAELGRNSYKRYCEEVRKPDNHALQTAKLYVAMYQQLETQDKLTLGKRKHRMEEAILQSFDICRHYIIVLFASVVTFFLIYYVDPVAEVRLILSLVWFAGVAKKTVEYITNRFCFIDAKLLLVYQAVLKQLCDGKLQETARDGMEG